MILADTSVWVDFLRHKAAIADAMRLQLERGGILAAECVFGELLQGARDARERRVLLDYWTALPKAEEGGLWIDAGTLSNEQGWLRRGVGLIDAALVALARRRAARVWTLDRRLLAVLDPAETFRPV